MTLIGAIHCFLYIQLSANNGIPFLQSLYWSAIRWCSWIAFTPSIVKLVHQLQQNELSWRQFSKCFLKIALVFGMAISIIYSFVDNAFLRYQQSRLEFFYDVLLRELPLSLLTISVIVFVNFYYFYHQEVNTEKATEQPPSRRR